MDGGSGDFTEDARFSSASNPAFLVEPWQLVGNVLPVPPGLRMAMGRRDLQKPQEETVLLRLAKLCIRYFTDIFLTALFPSLPHPLLPRAEGCSPRCLHGKTFRRKDWPNVLQENWGGGGD